MIRAKLLCVVLCSTAWDVRQCVSCGLLVRRVLLEEGKETHWNVQDLVESGRERFQILPRGIDPVFFPPSKPACYLLYASVHLGEP